MERQGKKLLHDVLQSIEAIDSYIAEKRIFAYYQSNRQIKRAIERELEIIGEAMKRLLDIYPDVKITDPRRIVDFRNRISHGYDTVDDAIVWGIIINHLPKLKAEVTALLNTD